MENTGEGWVRGNRRKKLVILAMIALLAFFAPRVMELVSDKGIMFPAEFGSTAEQQLPLAGRIAVGAALLVAMWLLARWNWRISDEVRRAHLMRFWAAIGLAIPPTFFVFLMFGSFIPEAFRLLLAFTVPLAIGLLFQLARSVRYGFVW